MKGAIGGFDNGTTSNTHNLRALLGSLPLQTKSIKINGTLDEADLTVIKDLQTKTRFKLLYNEDCTPQKLPAFSCKAIAQKIGHYNPQNGPDGGVTPHTLVLQQTSHYLTSIISPQSKMLRRGSSQRARYLASRGKYQNFWLQLTFCSKMPRKVKVQTDSFS